MKVSYKWVKPIPEKQMRYFEDRVVYNTAVFTREYTKNQDAFPYLSGTLAEKEMAAPISGSNLSYGLEAGVSYAKYVWKMDGVEWTNKATQPQWYYTEFKKNAEKIVNQAVSSALKEI